MKRIAAILLSLLMATQFILAQEKARSPEAGQAYNDGLNFAKKRKYEDAIPKFQAAIKADDNFPEAHYMLGYCHKKLNQYNEAEVEFKKAIDLNNQFEKAYLALADLQTDADRKTDAINTFSAVLSFNEDSYKAHFGLGRVYYEQQKYSQAIKHLQKSAELDPKYVYAWNYLGLTLKQMGRLEEAATAFQQAIDNEQRRLQTGNYYYFLGQVQLDRGNYKSAEQALLEALKISRSSRVKAGSNFYLGEVYKKTGQTQKALLSFQKAANNSAWKQAAEYEIDLIKNPDKYVN